MFHVVSEKVSSKVRRPPIRKDPPDAPNVIWSGIASTD